MRTEKYGPLFLFRHMPMIVFVLLLLNMGCEENSGKTDNQPGMKNQSFSNPEEARTRHLNWKVNIDFEKKQIQGTATWVFERPGDARSLCFDTYALGIEKVWVNDRASTFELGSFDKLFGSQLRIPVQPGDTVVKIQYHTGAIATALQWMKPDQTAGKQYPYLFTQCESIHARSLLPCQDQPSNRITYEATVQAPRGMMALMSAENPKEMNPDGVYHFQMEKPISTYLIALACGDIAYQAIDSRCGVYTEPVLLKEAAAELSDIPNMMQAAEKLGGPYRWGRYDVLIAPPSFPIGGMENPRLTFATPTILAGDKSLVSLIAHEMAHSWSGNLVTNATWEDLWLNEGFTTYFERRIMEEIAGKEYNEMLWEIGYQDLESDFTTLGMNHEDTRLKIALHGRHPEEAFSNIPYEKGAVFLRMLETNCGRPHFDSFMNRYFSAHAFQTMTTEGCLAYMDTFLFSMNADLKEKLKVHEWIYEPGVPANCPKPASSRFLAVDQIRETFEKEGTLATGLQNKWSTHEWLHFFRKLPHPSTAEQLQTIDQMYHVTGTGNCEIADEWYRLALSSGYSKSEAAMREFLCRVGRKKFLEPLYGEMAKTEKGKKLALDIFQSCRKNYHPLTALKMARILGLKS